MASLRIPKAQQAGLALIMAMKDEALKELSEALNSAHPSLHPQVLAERLSTQVSALSAEEITQLLKTLVPLYQARDATNETVSEFAGAVCRAIEDSEIETLRLVPEQREAFVRRLEALLSFEKSLGVTSKAFDVMTERERILCRARILTDVRPVFGKPTERPTAALVTHNLKITYHQDDEHHDFYVALDSEDIRQLKRVLERAERKAKSLQSLLRESEVPCLEEA